VSDDADVTTVSGIGGTHIGLVSGVMFKVRLQCTGVIDILVEALELH